MTEAVQAVEAQEPPRITVVTPENFKSYVDDKLGVQPEAEPDPEAVAQEQLAKIEEEKAEKGGKAAEEPEEVDHPDEGKKNKLQKRFSELTTKRKEAEERARQEAERAVQFAREAEEAKRLANELRMKYEPPKTDEIGPEPQPNQFTDIAEYSKALKDWTAEKTIKEATQRAAAEAAQRAQEERGKKWMSRQEEARKAIPDYDDTLKSSSVMISDQMRDAIVESEIGPQILHYLARNPELADQMTKLPTGRMLVQMGKIEASLSKETSEPEQKGTAKVAEISKAPAPISPIKTGTIAQTANKIGSDGEFHGTYEEWKALRKAGKIK